MKYLGWNEFEEGAILFSFKEESVNAVQILPEERPYSDNNSHVASVGDWRVQKPVFNKALCIDCQFCWVYCPDVSIISRDKKMVGIDYQHCKGCGICVDVCPTNPKSLLMFPEYMNNDEAIAKWPQKDKE